MSEKLLSVGLDVGTTTTQMIVSELTVENRASAFAVPEMEITHRHICYRSPVHFTPLSQEKLVDSGGIRALVEEDYRAAGITREQVDTGAVIITGETSRKENAKAVLDALSDFAGEFVVATAGPELESILAAKGAGAADFSARTGKRVLHIDIGGGTSNLALLEDGKVIRAGCLNVGGRLLKFDSRGQVIYVSPVLTGLTDMQIGDEPTQAQVETLAQLLTDGLVMAAGLQTPTQLLQKLMTEELGTPWIPPEGNAVISFSGGVADCIEKEQPFLAFGDMGPELGQAIRKSLLCRGEYMLGQETIRATVIGAGCHSAQLSGSTVFCRGVSLPVKNLPVAVIYEQEQSSHTLGQLIAQRLGEKDAQNVVLAMPGFRAPTYEQVKNLAAAILEGVGTKAIYVCLEGDMAKALGQALCLRLPQDTPCLCIDRVRLQENSFLDVGAPVGPALPVVIKTLVLSQ